MINSTLLSPILPLLSELFAQTQLQVVADIETLFQEWNRIGRILKRSDLEPDFNRSVRLVSATLIEYKRVMKEKVERGASPALVDQLRAHFSAIIHFQVAVFNDFLLTMPLSRLPERRYLECLNRTKVMLDITGVKE